MMKFASTKDVIDKLGGSAAVAEMIGVTVNAVSNWRVSNEFPARTYIVMTERLRAANCTASPRLWSMVDPSDQRKAS